VISGCPVDADLTSEEICMGRLAYGETAAFIDHLQNCGSCRRIHETNLALRAAIRGAVSMPRPGKFITYQVTIFFKF
jgi:hypothetical protein